MKSQNLFIVLISFTILFNLNFAATQYQIIDTQMRFNTSQIETTLTNFTALIKIDTSNKTLFSDNPQGIYFTTIDNTATHLKAEYDSGWGTSKTYIWVGIPEQKNDTKIIVWIDKDDSTSINNNVSGLWRDAQYVGVWHGNGNETQVDSAGYNNVPRQASSCYSASNEIAVGNSMYSPNTQANACWGMANPINLPTGNSHSTETSWYYITGAQQFMMSNYYGDTHGTNTGRNTGLYYSNSPEIVFINYPGTVVYSGLYTQLNTPMFIANRVSGGSPNIINMYKNNEKSSNFNVGNLNTGNSLLTLGGINNGFKTNIKGYFDEVRIRSVASEDDWIKAEYGLIYEDTNNWSGAIPYILNLDNTTTFYTTNDLIGWVNISNELNSTWNITGNWYLNNTLFNTSEFYNLDSNSSGIFHNVQNISSQNTKKHDVWIFEIKAIAGVNSTPIIILNSPPVSTDLSTPNEVINTSLITATLSATDDDDDELIYFYEFSNDVEILQEYSTNNTFLCNENLCPINTNITIKSYATDTEADSSILTTYTSIIPLIEINSCQPLNSASQYYMLNSDVSINDATCFTITAPNVVLDCNGFSITGSNTRATYGVYSNQVNTTIKNCVIQSFERAINYDNALNIRIENNTILNGRDKYVQIYGTSSGSALVRSNNVTHAHYGIRTDGLVANNTVQITAGGESNSYGYSLESNAVSMNNTFTTTADSNIIGFNVIGGNVLIDCAGASIIGTNTSSSYGVYSNSSNTTVKNCNISSFDYGIYANATLNFTFENNSITQPYVTSDSSAIAITAGSSGSALRNSITSARNGIYGGYNNGLPVEVAYNNITPSGSSYNKMIYSAHNTHIHHNNIVGSLGTYPAYQIVEFNNITGYANIYGMRDGAMFRFNNISSTGSALIFSCTSSKCYDVNIYGNYFESNSNDSSKGIIWDQNGYMRSIFYNNTINQTSTAYNAIRAIKGAIYAYSTYPLSYEYTNNTIISASLGQTPAIEIHSDSGNNLIFYNNTIKSNYWVNSSKEVAFNKSNIGNIYYFANGTPSWEVYKIYDTNGDNWADVGADRPFNASNTPTYWVGSGADYHPYTTRTTWNIPTSFSTANSSDRHIIYLNVSAKSDANLDLNFTFSSSYGDCLLISSSNDDKNLTLRYECEATKEGQTQINISFTDGFYSNQTSLNLTYPDHEATITKPTISGTAEYGKTLTCEAGTWSDIDDDLENLTKRKWQWYNGTEEIINATSQTWKITKEYRGQTIFCSQYAEAVNWSTSNDTQNSTAVIIKNNGIENITFSEIINSTDSHKINFSVSAKDIDDEEDIIDWSFTTTLGACIELSNKTTKNTKTVFIECDSLEMGEEDFNIIFYEKYGADNYSSINFTYPDHEASLEKLTITPLSNNLNSNLTCNLINWTDIDGDLENVSSKNFTWYVNGVDVNINSQILEDSNFSLGDKVSCSVFVSAQNWTTSNVSLNSSEIYVTNQTTNLIILYPANNSMTNKCTFDITYYTSFQTDSENRNVHCKLYYQDQFIKMLTADAIGGEGAMSFIGLTNNGNYSVRCVATDSVSTSEEIEIVGQYYDMTSCYAKVYGTQIKNTTKTLTPVYKKLEIEYFDVSNLIAILLFGMSIFGVVAYSLRLKAPDKLKQIINLRKMK